MICQRLEGEVAHDEQREHPYDLVLVYDERAGDVALYVEEVNQTYEQTALQHEEQLEAQVAALQSQVDALLGVSE